MQETAQHKFNAPLPGESLTHELGVSPWQKPAQYSDINEVINYYTSRMDSDEFSMMLADVMEMGVPLTTLANTIQMSGVMEGKHSIDTGILAMPVIIENMMAIGDALGIKYNSGLEDDAKLMSDRDSLANRSIMKLRQEKDMTTKPVAKEPMPMKEEKPMGLMSRREE